MTYGLGAAVENWGNWLLPAMIYPLFGGFLNMEAQHIGWALIINRLIDSSLDPVFGWLSDNTRSSYGRRKPYILLGTILAALAFPLFFHLLEEGWSSMHYFWYFVVGSTLFISTISCFNVAYQSLGIELSPDYDERTSLFAYRGTIQKIAEIVGFGTPLFLTWSLFSGNQLEAARVLSFAIAALFLLFGFLMFHRLKEPNYENIVVHQSTRTKLVETIGGALSCKPFRAQLGMALCYGIGTSMVGGFGYFATVYYVCRGDVTLGHTWNFYMGISALLFGFLSIPVFSKLSLRFGKHSAMKAVLCSGICSFTAAWFFYSPSQPWLQLLASGLIAFTASGFWMIYGSLTADIVDYDELETGKRREGAFSSCSSYLLKIGIALGIGAPPILLSLVGFDQALGDSQSESAILALRVFLSGFPILGLILGLIFLQTFRLSKQQSKLIREQLEIRRIAKNSN